MDVYHKILVKIYKQAEGKTSKKVDFTELVKKEGFYPSHDDILNQLNNQGWIIDVGRNEVNITHWGIKEAKKADSGEGDTKRELERAAKKLKADAKQLLIVAEEFLAESSEENLNSVETKFDGLKDSLNKIKENM